MSTQPEGTRLTNAQLEQLSINSLRILAMDAVQQANIGHPEMPMGAAAMAYVLWSRFLRHNPTNPRWPDRDRFVLSAGHGSMLLYALLYLSGYDLSLEDLKRFRQWESRTPGHPEFGATHGVGPPVPSRWCSPAKTCPPCNAPYPCPVGNCSKHTGSLLMRKFGFSCERVIARARRLMERKP